MRRFIARLLRTATLSLLCSSCLQPALAEPARLFDREATQYAQLTVTGPYLEFHSGPGAGYPIFYVVPRGQHVEILFRRTDWFKVRDERDHEGWVSRQQVEQTELPSGEPLPLEDANHREIAEWPWQVTAESGRLGHGWNNALALGYATSSHLTLQLEADHQPTAAYDRAMVLAGLTHTFTPTWRIAPFVETGGGVERIQPNRDYTGTPARRAETVAYYGAGLRWSVNNRFEFRLHERNYILARPSQPNDPYEALHEWKAGFAFYF